MFFVTYRSDNKKIVGCGETSELSPDGNKIRVEVSKEDKEKVEQFLMANTIDFFYDEIMKTIITIGKEVYFLKVSSSATDTDGDGVSDIKADGVANCQITASLWKKQFNVETGVWVESAIVDIVKQLKFECSRGKLSALLVNTENGIANVTLTSVSETVLSEITVSCSDYQDAVMKIQFRP